ncbi:MAG: transcriptional regulator [Deltaproteobacteria bacterium]|nr:transcriptional regulator [Deltaproteobacteria bacterium]
MVHTPDDLVTLLGATRPDLGAADARALVDAWRAAGVARPGVTLPLEAFAAHALARAPEGSALSDLHLVDLHLACACARGDASALATFEREVLAPLAGAMALSGLGAGARDELLQEARATLLVRGDDGRARIETYGGRGPLAGWLRIVLKRLALRAARPRTDAPGDAVALERAPDPSPDAELTLLRGRYGAWFGGAMRRALAALQPQSARVVRLHFRDGLSLGDIGGRLGVDKSTVSRWLASARAEVLEALVGLARAELALSERELRSLVRVVRSRIHITLLEAASGMDGS